MAPLGALPYGAAYAVWVAVLALALAAAARALAPLAAPEQRARLAPFALLGLPSLVALVQGQTTPLMLLAAALALGGRTPALAALALRPQLLPLAAAARVRDRRALLALAGGTAAVLAVSLAVAGADGLARWPERLAYAAAETGGGEVSLPGTARRLGLGGGAALGFAAALYALSAAVLFRRPSLPAALALAVLAAPHALLHDLVLAYPAVAVAARSAARAWLLVGGGTAAVVLHLAGLAVAPLWLAAVAVAALRAR